LKAAAACVLGFAFGGFALEEERILRLDREPGRKSLFRQTVFVALSEETPVVRKFSTVKGTLFENVVDTLRPVEGGLESRYVRVVPTDSGYAVRVRHNEFKADTLLPLCDCLPEYRRHRNRAFANAHKSLILKRLEARFTRNGSLDRLYDSLYREHLREEEAQLEPEAFTLRYRAFIDSLRLSAGRFDRQER
jgi:hypothetical protein